MDEEIEPTAADQEPDPSASEPAEVIEPPARSGLPGVDSAVDRVGALDELPVEDHVEVFDDVQRRLHDALAELDDEQ